MGDARAPRDRLSEVILWVSCLGVVLGLVGVLYVKWRPIPTHAAYVGSARCSGCHEETHGAWSTSQHTKMMRPARDPGVVIADFTSPEAPFALDEVVWAIGGKWEQQFMGHDEKGETLLPGAWHGIANAWQLEGWDGWNQPIPLERCHGCHTVGLNVETGTFVEANIGCESCHGPAEWHVQTRGLGRITAIHDAEVCGQCHARGRHVDGRLHFPAGYRPGGRLEAVFTFSEPLQGQSSNDWWGNGRARSRHQEFLDWKQGGHADSLRSLREGYDGRFGEVTEECLRCHSADVATGTNPDVSVAEARAGVTCSVCHNVHGDLERARVECSACHTKGARYHEPERNATHVLCGPAAKVSCADCHMPRIVRIAGAEQLHSHAPGIVPPSDGAAYQMRTSCTQGGCHAQQSLEQLQVALENHAF